MSRKYKFKDQDELYFVIFTIVHWIDLFIRVLYKDILVESWKFCQEKKGLEIYSWSIMTSHAHMIIGSHQNKMEDILRDMKRFTSSELRSAIQTNPLESRADWMMSLMKSAGQENNHHRGFQLWQEGNHPIQLSTPGILDQKMNYIHNNPVEAGFVDRPEDYLYSSARDYCQRKGLIDIIILE
jgi:putative transposase